MDRSETDPAVRGKAIIVDYPARRDFAWPSKHLIRRESIWVESLASNHHMLCRSDRRCHWSYWRSRSPAGSGARDSARTPLETSTEWNDYAWPEPLFRYQSALFGGGFAGFLSHKHEGLGSYRQPALGRAGIGLYYQAERRSLPWRCHEFRGPLSPLVPRFS